MISIIIPTFNACNLLVLAVDSVLKQTWKDFELIIVNDGSTDKTEDLVKKYLPGGSDYDSRVKYIKADRNKGKTAALNKGIRAAQGTYLMFLDQDDTLPSESLRIGVEFLMSHSTVVAIYGDALKIDISGKPFGIRKSKQVGSLSDIAGFYRNPIASSSMIMRKQVIDKVGSLDESFFRIDDVWRNINVFLCGRIEYIPSVLLNYRIYRRSAILKYRLRTIYEFYILLNRYFTIYEKYTLLLKQMTFQMIKLTFELFSFYK
ncbi:MAG: glycosyltransferase family 2 protein [Candidatus Latescibacteria bacterium]|nr:glycosyltransferase family 2 protein [Candidatus Latescibacterota bacterium]